jgi:hypothetical protein
MKSPVFQQLMQVISLDKFHKTASKYSGDRYSKTFTSLEHLKLMVYFQLAGRTSIRDVINSLKSKTEDLYHSSIKVPSRNNLSHQNSNRDYRIFRDTFYSMKDKLSSISALSQRKKFKFDIPVKSFDSSTISLCKDLFEWAKFRKNKSGIKMHTLLNNETGLPDFLAITEARGHDSKGLWKISIEDDTIYVLDRAYLCLKWLYSVVLKNSHFVMRLKTNTKHKVLKSFKINETNKNRGVILDQEIKFTGVKKDDYPQSLRKIKFKHFESGKVFEFITDNFELSPFTISEIYKDRWQIELFFKKIKQNLKIKKFIGLSENAVQIQIWTALIVLLLFEYAKFLSRASLGLKEFLSIIQPNLFSRKRLESILHLTEWNNLILNQNCTIQQFTLF